MVVKEQEKLLASKPLSQCWKTTTGGEDQICKDRRGEKTQPLRYGEGRFETRDETRK